jgi:hypothetical protein
MKLSAPTKPVFIIATVLGGLGIAGYFVQIPVVSDNQYWFVVAGWFLLTLSTVLKGF